jgi:5-methylcytosine-specific restriction endonuclease McrA
MNGNSLDNRIENLRFLCPNCHSQTETYTGKNMKYQKEIKSVNGGSL